MAIQVAPENVVGRDHLIDRIWRKLRRNSLQFTAERRIGKTTVMTKMAAEPRSGFEVLFLELEGIDSPERFTELLLNRSRPLLSRTAKAKGWLETFRDSIGGTEIGGVIKLPTTSKMGWQTTLQKTLEGLCEHQADKTILLLMDELPYMLQKIASISAAKKTLALTLLDTLRSIRQQQKNLRMVYAGSVGLHHVVTDLKQSQLASEPVNDMPSVEIHALSEPDAIQLATLLLDEEQVQFAEEELEAILQPLIALTDCVPFYIESVSSRLGELNKVVNPEDVTTTVRQQLTSDLDPWEMEHFRNRLKIYYNGYITDTSGREIPNDEIARSLLDALSVVTQPQTIEQIWSAVKAEYALTDRQHIVQMLRSLALDHYLTSDTDKRYSFRFPLIQKWWKMAQGLDA